MEDNRCPECGAPLHYIYAENIWSVHAVTWKTLQRKINNKAQRRTKMDLSNVSRKGLEQALRKALDLLPPEGVEEVVATFPERLPAIDHTRQKTSEALGIGEEAFYAVAEATTAFGKTLMQEGEQLRSKHVESILHIWKVFDEREKALFTVLLAEFTLQQMAKTLSERFLELAIRARMAEAGRREGEDESH